LIQSSLKSFDLSFESKCFSILLFYIDSFGIFNTVNESDESLRLTDFVIGNVVEELVNRKIHGVMVEIDEMLACLLNYNEENLSAKKEAVSCIVDEAKQFLQEKFHINLTISISDSHQGVENIHKAYQEALEAMEYRMVLGSGKFIYYADVKTAPYAYYYPEEFVSFDSLYP